MPLLDPRLRKAIENFPELVMAGACIPDLAVISSKFSDTHRWQHAHDLIERAQNEKELAIAIGYASHLYIDVIAHNHFVPAHEEMWWDKGMMAHIASEWAMDAHLSPLLNDSPKKLLTANIDVLTNFIAPQFNRTLVETKRAKDGERVVVIAGVPPGVSGTTNGVRVHEIGRAGSDLP
jgi:hypothetical protein